MVFIFYFTDKEKVSTVLTHLPVRVRTQTGMFLVRFLKEMKPYPAYKDSGIERIGMIPAHWNLKRLKYCFNFHIGWIPPTGTSEYFIGNNKWATIADMKQKFINDTEMYISNDAIEKSGIKLTPKGSLLYSFKLTVGKVVFAGCNLYTNEAVISIIPNKEYNLDFYYYLLPEVLIHNARENIYGAKLLNQELIKNSCLILPTTDEQKTIADYLDHKTAQIDDLITKKERMIELLKEERTAVINQAVTKGLDPNVEMKDSGIEWLGNIPKHWKIKRLKFVVNVNPTRPSDIPDDLMCVFIPMELMGRDGTFDNSNLRPFLEIKTGFTYFAENDVIFAKITPCFENGKGALLQNLGSHIGFGSTEFHVLRAIKNKTIPKFIYYLTLSAGFRKIGEAFMQGVAGQKRVTNAFVQNYIFALPSIGEQEKISSYLDKKNQQMDSQVEREIKSIELLKEYRTALISEVVTGKIDMRGEI